MSYLGLFQKNVEMDSERPKDNLQPVVPDPAVLTFGAEKLIKLVKAPFEEVIYLHNKSLTTTMDFSLQVYPAKFFTVRPSFGSLRWGESLAIKVMFHSRPAEESVSQEIRGCLKVRSALGFTMERYVNSPSFLTFYL